MSRKINVILYSFILLLAVSACEQDRIFPEYDDLEHGAYPRLLSKTGDFFFTDVANSRIVVSVEFYDDNNGQNVDSYSWTVSYIDKANGGANSQGPKDIMTINASEFSTNPSTGLPSATFSFTLQQVFDVFGFTVDDVNGGDAFRFLATVTLKDGRSFSSENTGTNVISSAPFAGLFAFDANLLCTSDLAGDYTQVTTYHQHDFIGGGYTMNTQDATIVEIGTGQYRVDGFDGGLYSEGPYVDNYGTTALTFEFTDACGKLSWQDQTDPWQNLLQDPDRASFIDFETGVITISVVGDVYGENWTVVYTPK